MVLSPPRVIGSQVGRELIALAAEFAKPNTGLMLRLLAGGYQTHHIARIELAPGHQVAAGFATSCPLGNRPV